MRRRARHAAISSALLIIGLGLFALTLPAWFASLVAWMQVPPRLYLAAAIRFGVGVAFLRAARGSRAPYALYFLGGVMAIGGLVTPVIGQGLARPILDAWRNGGNAVVRGWGVGASVLGGFALWALLAPEPSGVVTEKT